MQQAGYPPMAEPVPVQHMPVTLPPGVVPGQQIQVQTPAGLVAVTVPAVPPGSTLMIEVPAAAAAPPVVQSVVQAQPVPTMYPPQPPQPGTPPIVLGSPLEFVGAAVRRA